MTTPTEDDVFDLPSLDDCDEKELNSELQTQENSNTDPENAAVNSKSEFRLCGYLNKLNNRSILKTIRKRWFVFSESNCRLYYYRSPQDNVPLGEIDISQATFSFEVDNKERTGLFTISVPDREYLLEANNRQTCLFWLQELQKHRRSNSLLRTKQINSESVVSSDLGAHPQSGLLAKISNEGSNNTLKEELQLMLPVDCPQDVGDESAVNSQSNPFLIAQQKFNELRSQMRVSAVRHEKLSSHSSQMTPEKEDSSQNKVTSASQFYAQETVDGNKSQPVQRPKSQALSALRLKISSSFRKSSGEHQSIDDQGKDKCSRCHRLESKVESLNDEVSVLREEVSASREVLSVLQRQIDIAAKEKDTLVQIYQLKESEDTLKLFSERDNQIVNLTHDIQHEKQNVENLQNHITMLKSEVVDLQRNNELFQELLIQKDKTIMALTNEIFELETDRKDQEISRSGSISSSDPESIKSPVEPKESMSLDDLKDAVQAFTLQNKFLNKEILELNQLRRDAEEREQLLLMKCSEWEARSYQMQSKLLFLLNEFKKSDVNFNHDIVNELLKEATEGGASNLNFMPAWANEKLYDDLGFNWQWGKENLLSTKAVNLRQKSEDIASKMKDPEFASWRSKWDNFMASLGSKELQRSPELKVLLRLGIPNEYKGKIWRGCVQMWVKKYKSFYGPNYYNSLLVSDEYATKIDPSSKQIELDLLRTLPNNHHYENLDSDGVPKLRRVLLAYSRHDPAVGYCQGLNRLAAIALLFMDEEDAFWCMVAITKFIMPDGYYSRTLIASQVDQRVLKDLMSDKCPRLHAHLDQNNVDLSLFTFNWFLTVFVDSIPVETYLRIWDVFLYEGSKVLFRYALAFFKMCENEILQLKDYMVINKYLRNIAEEKTDVKKLTHIAFNELNPFPQRVINSKRVQHMQVVKAELEELESVRNSLPRSDVKIMNMEVMSEED